MNNGLTEMFHEINIHGSVLCVTLLLCHKWPLWCTLIRHSTKPVATTEKHTVWCLSDSDKQHAVRMCKITMVPYRH